MSNNGSKKGPGDKPMPEEVELDLGDLTEREEGDIDTVFSDFGGDAGGIQFPEGGVMSIGTGEFDPIEEEATEPNRRTALPPLNLGYALALLSTKMPDRVNKLKKQFDILVSFEDAMSIDSDEASHSANNEIAWQLAELIKDHIKFEEYIRSQESKADLGELEGKVLNLSQAISNLKSEISEMRIEELFTAINEVQQVLADEEEKIGFSDNERGHLFSMRLLELVNEIVRLQHELWGNQAGSNDKPIEVNEKMTDQIEELLKVISILKSNPETTLYLKTNVIQPIEESLERVKSAPVLELRRDQDRDDLKILLDKAQQIDRFFRDQPLQTTAANEEEAQAATHQYEPLMSEADIEEAERRETERVKWEIRRLMDEADALEEKGKIAEARKKEAEGRQMITEFCASPERYKRMWKLALRKRKESSQILLPHNFMIEKEEPHILIRSLVEDHFILEQMRAEYPNVRILELGPGIGNDAVYMLTHIPNLKEYRGVEVSPEAAKVCRERIKRVLAGRSGLICPEWRIEEGNFSDRLPEIAEGLEAEGELALKKPVIVVSISTMHYKWEEKTLEDLEQAHRICWLTGGFMVIALKTPQSDSWKDHDQFARLKKNQENKKEKYYVGVHKTERIMRAFMSKEKIISMMDKAGFDMKNAITFLKVVEGFDFDGQKEAFWCTMAWPKNPRKAA